MMKKILALSSYYCGNPAGTAEMQMSGFSPWRRTLVMIFLAALLIRVVFILTLQNGFYFADGWKYLNAANHLVTHGDFPTDYGRAPLYPLFLATVHYIVGEGIVYARIVQAILGAVIAVLIALIGGRVGGFGIGAVAGILWAIYPMGAFITGVIYPTTLLTLLIACGVLCLVTKPDDDRYPWRVALAGLFFGLAALAKPIVLVTVVFIALWIALRRQTGRMLLVSIFLLTTVTALAPWAIRNAYVHGRLVPVESRGLSSLVPWANAPVALSKGGNKGPAAGKKARNKSPAAGKKTRDKGPAAGKKGRNKSPAVNSEIENDTWAQLRRMARRYPGEFVAFFELYPRRVGFLKQEKRDKVIKRNTRLVRYTIFGTNLVMVVSIVSVSAIFTFALIGIRAMWRDREKRYSLSLLILLVMSFALGYAVTWGKIRYRIPVDPYIIILSAWGVMYVWNTLLKRQSLPD